MTIILSEHQAAVYDEGFQAAHRIHDDCIELADRQGWTGPFVIETVDGRVLFALTPAPRK
jgi:hypothetical protein